MADSVLTSNHAVETAAVEFVIGYELRRGRLAVDRRYRPGYPADIESDGRLIEVKASGTSFRSWFLPLEESQRAAALSNDAFFIYVVENVRQGDPARFTLRILDSAHLRRLLKKAKLRSYYEMPWPTADYDATPAEPRMANDVSSAPTIAE